MPQLKDNPKLRFDRFTDEKEARAICSFMYLFYPGLRHDLTMLELTEEDQIIYNENGDYISTCEWGVFYRGNKSILQDLSKRLIKYANNIQRKWKKPKKKEFTKMGLINYMKYNKDILLEEISK